MIGPHEGKELELMLAGKKPLAAFGDIIPEDGIIAEEIIPEKAFASYVEEGRFIRISEDVSDPLESYTMRYVCFTQPDQEWRAHTFINLRKAMRLREIPNDNHMDVMIGRILGYNEEDIEEFIEKRHS